MALQSSLCSGLRVLTGAALLVVAMMNPAQSEAIPGQAEPALMSAIHLWLSDDDRLSLPALASLAQGGNRAAQLLLARIEATDRASSGFVRNELSRSERLRLFRAPAEGRRFPPSWVRHLAGQGDRFAVALKAATDLGIDLAPLRALFDLGEVQAAEHLVRKIGVDGSQAQRRATLRIVGTDSEWAPYLNAFIAVTRETSTGRNALARMVGRHLAGNDRETEDAALFADIGYQSGTGPVRFGPDNPFYPGVAKWLLTAPETRPFASVCHPCAVAGRSACAVTALGLAGGYYEAVRFDSPLEAVISQDRFASSPRARNMVLRRIASAWTESGAPVMTRTELAQHSICLAAAVEMVTGRVKPAER